MRYLLDILYFFAIIIYLPKALYKRYAQNRYKTGLKDRLGYISCLDKQKKHIWIHAVSVGEVNATRTLIDLIKQRMPDVEIVMSTTTDTGFERANALYGNDLRVFYFPFDFSLVMKRAFDNINPDLCILVELEVWPNFVRVAKDKKIPVIVFNGRLSDRSFPRYKLVKPFVKRMFDMVDMFLVQADEYAEKFMALGVDPEKIRITGSVKYDTASVGDKVAGSQELANALSIKDSDMLIVAGGTGNGEEEIVLDVYKQLISKHKNIKLAIVPRKPERFDEVAGLIEHKGFDLVRYSKIKAGTNQDAIAGSDVILGDTMGDLRKFYALSSLVFVGRSLCPMGGSDMMESAAMGRFTVFGKHTFNFRQTVDALLAANGAVEVADGIELAEILDKALQDKIYKSAISENGKRVIQENQGATEKSFEVVCRLLNEKSKN